MKQKILGLIILLLNSIQAFSQTPDWVWAKSAGCNLNDQGRKTTTDQNGNVYAIGYFGYSSNDTLIFGIDTLISAGQNDIFIVKYASNGNVLWAQRAGGNLADNGNGIVADDNNNIYLTGFFLSDTIAFGSFILTNHGHSNLFLTKFDENGNVLWAKAARGDTLNSDYSGSAVNTDHNGNVYLTGNFHGNMILGNDTLSGNFWSIFVAKYDSAGNEDWGNTGTSNGNQPFSEDVVADGNGNVFITGQYGGVAFTLDTIILNNNGHNDLFIAKYDSSGNILWAKHQDGGGTFNELCTSIVADSAGNVYIAGQFQSISIIFGTDTLINANATQNNNDIFIVKYDTDGNVVWARREGEANPQAQGEIPFDLATKGNNYFYMTGGFVNPSIIFGTDTLYGNGIGYGCIYVVKYDLSGNPIWAKGADASDGSHTGYGIAVDLNDNVYVTGIYTGTYLTFGADTLIHYGSPLNQDFFLAKIGTPNTTSISNFEPVTSNFQIFPNPVTNELNIKTNSNDLSEIIIYDITLRKLLQQSFTNSTSINTSHLSKGIYIYELRNKNGPDSYREIKKGKVVKE